jgi:OOP family OmpA-OmpF porin
MKNFKIILLAILSVSSIMLIASCKARKLAKKPTQPDVAANTKPIDMPKPQVAAPITQQPQTAEKPNFNFSNVQFDFNSYVLRTGSIETLDKVATEMKKFPAKKFTLNGYASAEGTEQHNLVLSKERSNAVKTYLLNDGVDVNDLATKGYGEEDPIASNDTEQGRETNRRVEIKLN